MRKLCAQNGNLISRPFRENLFIIWKLTIQQTNDKLPCWTFNHQESLADINANRNISHGIKSLTNLSDSFARNDHVIRTGTALCGPLVGKSGKLNALKRSRDKTKSMTICRHHSDPGRFAILGDLKTYTVHVVTPFIKGYGVESFIDHLNQRWRWKFALRLKGEPRWNWIFLSPDSNDL